MDSSNALGEYLRARREQVRPADVGIVPGGLRRVPGLRREEVALLAGISADYYLRLEQGRDRNKFTDILAVNELCTALSPNYRVGVNMMRAVFLDPAEHALRRDWLDLTDEAVAVLRANVGPDLSDPRLVELVTELRRAVVESQVTG
ncbi:MmyB family transcriptional regulator [Actinophytocola algeriensis]|uniref:Transcriptional regulator with XRE-family HTH domain n=1 Tax=Actinophytocola algeriensis TaxID=1768010 RepID=A0A7W7Q5M0_9PSEU|nr:helix-turn-helix domain-containing protein [Actinophytocola algeriensis]MBB4907253.1 transcriptional regulator with XRE-family HTH domain [Actinophytocola algeriensis]MBE1478736.1 transcriptional regulator with XRE-family HTH domain [Actinophytocola algeriensis]